MGFTLSPMVEATATSETYAVWLRRQMDERGFTQRSLAKAWNESDVENARRAVRRYLKGMVPIERTRKEIARALGSTEIGPAPDPDKEED